jgi:thiamine biosynthesis lipoprotein
MMRSTRRRFLAIAAVACATSSLPAAVAAPVTRWRGVALGASASITLAHPRADRLIAAALAEIDRLEDVFSLHRPGSALARLNAAGALEAPPFDLVECLAVAGAVHRATGGAFDPTVQPLWAAHAAAWAAGAPPGTHALAAARALKGWEGVSVAPDRIALARPGMALTLNGVAQGFIADRVARLLAAEGLTDVLIDTGEAVARGRDPFGAPWAATLPDGRRETLSDAALATSAPLGTVFDAAGAFGHILDPETGLPAAPRWRFVTVAAPSAAVADALSTACCLLDGAAQAASVESFPGARLVAAA